MQEEQSSSMQTLAPTILECKVNLIQNLIFIKYDQFLNNTMVIKILIQDLIGSLYSDLVLNILWNNDEYEIPKQYFMQCVNSQSFTTLKNCWNFE